MITYRVVLLQRLHFSEKLLSYRPWMVSTNTKHALVQSSGYVTGHKILPTWIHTYKGDSQPMNKKRNIWNKNKVIPDRCCITRICGCYVDGENKTDEKSLFLKRKLLNTLKFSKNPFPAPSEKSDQYGIWEQEKEGGTQEFLRSSGEASFRILHFWRNFMISIQRKIMGKTTTLYWSMQFTIFPASPLHGMEMFDASDEIYDHIL